MRHTQTHRQTHIWINTSQGAHENELHMHIQNINSKFLAEMKEKKQHCEEDGKIYYGYTSTILS